MTFVNTLAENLWYIDDDHKAFLDRYYPIPPMFEGYSGYNRPEMRKERKRDHTNLKINELKAHSSSLYALAGSSYLKRQSWPSVYEAILKLAESLRQYSNYLIKQGKAVAECEAKRSLHNDVDELAVLGEASMIKPTLAARYKSLHSALLHSTDYEPILLEDYCPTERRKKHEYKESIVVPVGSVLYTYTGSRYNVSFIWRIPNSLTETELLQNMVQSDGEVITHLSKAISVRDLHKEVTK